MVNPSGTVCPYPVPWRQAVSIATSQPAQSPSRWGHILVDPFDPKSYHVLLDECLPLLPVHLVHIMNVSVLICFFASRMRMDQRGVYNPMEAPRIAPIFSLRMLLHPWGAVHHHGNGCLKGSSLCAVSRAASVMPALSAGEKQMSRWTTRLYQVIHGFLLWVRTHNSCQK